MKTDGVHPERIRHLNEREIAHGDYVLYWMQRSQRAEWNDALEFSIEQQVLESKS